MELKQGYKQTEVGVIPAEWKIVKIKEMASISTGKRNTQDRIEDGKYPFFVRSSTVERINSYSFDGEAVLTAGDGVGTGKVFHYINGKFDLHQRVYKISDFCSDLDGYFFFLFFSNYFFDRIMSMTAKSSVDSVRREMIADMLIPLPSIDEQKAIKSALSDVDAHIDALDRLIAKKRNIKQATMQELLTGKKRLPGFASGNGYKQTEVGLIPEDWNAKTLGDVMIHCFSGATPSRSRPDFYKGNIRWITSGELNYNIINDTAEKISKDAVIKTNLKLVPKNTFLMAITGLEAEGTRGSCGIVGEESTTNQSCMAIFPTNELLTEYLFHYYVLRGKALALKYCQGTKQQSYTAKIVKLITLPLPSREEQGVIASILSDMDAEIAALEALSEKIRELKQGMMQELLTGRIRLVQGAEA